MVYNSMNFLIDCRMLLTLVGGFDWPSVIASCTMWCFHSSFSVIDLRSIGFADSTESREN